MTALLTAKLADPDAERVRLSHAQALTELQGHPVMSTVIINNVELEDGRVTLIPHKLGRKPRIALHSAPRGATLAGIITEIVDVAGGNPDRTKYVALKAGGMGATVTVDVEVK